MTKVATRRAYHAPTITDCGSVSNITRTLVVGGSLDGGTAPFNLS